MARGVAPLLTAVLLAVPTLAAFASGGTTDVSRATLGAGACALLALAAVAAPGRLVPRSRAAAAALAALAGLAAWTAISHAWSPAPARADAALQLAVIYLALVAAASLLLRPRTLAAAVEPAVAAGAVVVIGYGLAGRLLPGFVHLTATARAGGRLEEPLTYWNAMGALAAIGLVLAARLAGDVTRGRACSAARVLAAAATPILGAGVYLSFSRTAIAATAVGLLLLVAFDPVRSQARAVVIAVVGAALGIAATAPLDGVRALAGTLSAREGQGAAALLLLVSAMAAAAGLHLLVAERAVPRRGLSVRLRRAAGAAAVLLAVVPFATALANRSDGGAATFGATSSRLTATGSNRAEYWRVAVDTFAGHPLRGAGAGSFDPTWLRRRPIDERVRNAHSLELETAAELGLVGVLLLGAFLVAVGLAARSVLRADAALAAGPAAALAAWLLHASVDWDWQVPALTAVAALLAGLLVARARPLDRSSSAAAVSESPTTPAVPTPDADLTLAPPPGHPRFPMLDGVRAIAALSVVCVHVSDASGFSNRAILGSFATRLNVGVALFFVLSGFLLYRPFVAARLDRRPAPGVGRYLWRRALRILPAYAVALAVLGALGWIGFALGWWRYLLFGQTLSIYTIFSGITPAWTLDIEVLFYLALPLWALAAAMLLRGRPRDQQLRLEALGLAGLFAAGLASRLAAVLHDRTSLWLVNLPTHLDWFAAGMALALLTLWIERRPVPRVLRPVAARPAVAWGAALGTYLITAYAVGLPKGLSAAADPARNVAGHVLYLAVAVLIALPAVLGIPQRSGAPSRAIGRVLSHPAVTWLGLISYGIFLWHQPFLMWLIRQGLLDEVPLPVPTLLVLTLAGSIAVGAASHYVVERPFLRLKEPRRMRRAREPEPATAG